MACREGHGPRRPPKSMGQTHMGSGALMKGMCLCVGNGWMVTVTGSVNAF